MGYKHGRKNKSTKEEINHGLIIRQSAPLSYMLVQFHTHTPSEDTGLRVCDDDDDVVYWYLIQ